jgi:hypothetical protein
LRYPSEKVIRQRAERAYHRAQAIARNQGYKNDIATLEALGLTFGLDGLPAPEHFVDYRVSVLEEKISRLARLACAVTPARLRSLTVDETVDYGAVDYVQIFPDIPGWDVVPKNKRRLGSPRRVPGDLRRLFLIRPIAEVRVGAQLRNLVALKDAWKVFDLRQEDRGEREIIELLWPTEPRTAETSSEKDPLRQRVYDLDRRARRLIGLVYPRGGVGVSEEWLRG